MRRTRSCMATVMAGCRVCHGPDAVWRQRNALALAARHHDATGHETWAEQTIIVIYGGEDGDADRARG